MFLKVIVVVVVAIVIVKCFFTESLTEHDNSADEEKNNTYEKERFVRLESGVYCGGPAPNGNYVILFEPTTKSFFENAACYLKFTDLILQRYPWIRLNASFNGNGLVNSIGFVFKNTTVDAMREVKKYVNSCVNDENLFNSCELINIEFQKPNSISYKSYPTRTTVEFEYNFSKLREFYPEYFQYFIGIFNSYKIYEIGVEITDETQSFTCVLEEPLEKVMEIIEFLIN